MVGVALGESPGAFASDPGSGAAGAGVGAGGGGDGDAAAVS